VIDGKGVKSEEEVVAEVGKKRGCNLQGLKKLEQKCSRKEVAWVEEVRAEVGQEKRLQGLRKEQWWMEGGV
jgi:hypothetical protein